MITARIIGHTRYLGAPVGWEPEKHGPCGHLAVRDISTHAGPAMQSAWEPTPSEIERIKAGASIILTVIGSVHPPVALTVGEIPA